MKTDNEKTINILNDLIEVCRDGQQGFKSAADDAKDAALKRQLADFSLQRSRYITELQQQVRLLGGDPDKRGSAIGALHRGWIDLKAAISSNEPHAVLAECERGEDSAVKNYREALAKTELDSSSRTLVQKQFAGIQQAHDTVKALRDSPVYAQS
ncbi:MAG TPA: PA2169 family four-helix-bundle protein [Opitutaceae bacterium]|nr:PA2169 family four-helix-bundle protein [Opitutaceae bacterium]